MEDVKQKIIDEYKEGNIVILTEEGLKTAVLNDFIQQPADGILYDLNRIEPVVLTFIPDPKWINDYAVSQVIRALKEKADKWDVQEQYGT